MKHYYLILVSFLMLVCTAKAEIEPNDTYNNANPLAPNGSDVGGLTTSTDILDWWKVTTTADGQLTVTTISSASLIISLAMYDIDGVTYIKGNDLPTTGTTQSTHYDNLLPGTSYYIEVNNYNGGTGTYTITSVFNAAPLAVDPMNNDAVAGAVVLPLNGSSTGHIGYTDTGYVDQHDWWKVTVPQDGELIVRTTIDTTADIDLEMYDADGVTQIAVYDTSLGIHEATHYSHLMPGTYFIDCYLPSLNNRYGSYTITSIFNPANFTNDPENNDSMEVSVVLGVNTSATGHLGYYTLGYTDYDDWYSVTVPLDGQLIVSTTSDSTGDIDLLLYDINGTTQIAQYDTGYGIHESTHYNNLMPGTYFVNAHKAFAVGYCAYTITTVFNPAALPNDVENNDVSGSALLLAYNDSLHGHLGYYSDGYTDIADWYYVTIPAGLDSFIVETLTDSTLELDFDFYASSDLVNSLYTGSYSGIADRILYPLPPAGTYYIRARRYSGYGTYNIKNTGYDVNSVNEIAGQIFSIYPNPAKNFIQWKSTVNLNGEYEVALINQLGQVVASQATNSKTGALNISSFARGVYCIQFKENGMVVGSMKVVKE